VTDNGSPVQSDSETITIIVNEVNSAPVLGSIGNKTASEGTQLAFTVTATDSDLPAQTLTFSLDAGAPAGASISSGGAFTWTPSETQGGTTNTITVRVTDNGSPAQTDTETISVIVVRRPRMVSISISGGVATLVWESFSGKHYQLQTSADLNAWADRGSPIQATSSTASTTHAIGASSVGFYRVVQVD